MRALSIVPRARGSLRLEERPGPPRGERDVLVQALALGICGTDDELIEGHFGCAPEGSERLVLGHESLGRVLEAPAGCALRPGDRVVGIVRHPDPVPCGHCAIGEWDMCSNGLYTERGIKAADGFGAEQWVSAEDFLVRVEPSLGLAAVLLEPASVLAKAWEHVECIGRRARWLPARVLVTGAGPVGLMAALMGVQRHLDVHVQDHNTDGPKPGLVRDLGARYSSRPLLEPFDVVIECTGVPEVIRQVLGQSTPNQVVCLAGLSSGESQALVDVAPLNQRLVQHNRVVFGSINANRRHFVGAAEALARAERGWLERLITRKLPLARWEEAYERRPGDVKTVLEFT